MGVYIYVHPHMQVCSSAYIYAKSFHDQHFLIILSNRNGGIMN